MSDTKPRIDRSQPKGSLWTTPSAELASLPGLEQPLVDTSVTVEQIREAVDATKRRAAAFSGKVSDDVLRTSVE